MIFLKIFQKLLKLLHSEISPAQLAGGFALGSIIGLTPFASLQNIAVFVIILILKVNIGAAFFGITVFGLLGFFTDPLADLIGYYLLADSPGLTSFWARLYNMPIVPFTRFNNTVVLGSFVIAVMLLIPVYFAAKKFVIYYRANLKEKVEKIKIVKLLKVSKLFSFYDQYK